jgi:hypothetical protein
VKKFIHEEGDEISEVESVLGLACMALLKPNINFERPNSGVVVHFKGKTFVVDYDGDDGQLHLYDVSDDERITKEPQGTMIVLEPEPN